MPGPQSPWSRPEEEASLQQAVLSSWGFGLAGAAPAPWNRLGNSELQELRVRICSWQVPLMCDYPFPVQTPEPSCYWTSC